MSVKLEVVNSEQFTKCEMYILGTFLRQKSLSKNLRFSDQCQNRIQTSTFQITVFENHSKMSHLTNIFFQKYEKIKWDIFDNFCLFRTRKKAVLEMVNEEVSILKNVCHDNILSMIGAYQGGNEVIMVSEYLPGGELFEKVASDDYHLTEMQCVQFMHQICEGVSYLHRKVNQTWITTWFSLFTYFSILL